MKVEVNLRLGQLTYEPAAGIVIRMAVSCRVRTLANKQRTTAVKDVVRTIPLGLPYDPITFPKGTWNITDVEWRDYYGFNEWEYGDVKIRTDAYAMVETWLLDQDGNYWKPTGNKVRDSGYLLHYSTSTTTLGCIRIEHQDDAIAFAKYIEPLIQSEGVSLVVA